MKIIKHGQSLHEYIGVYEEEFIQTHMIKIQATDRVEADVKFIEYLKNKNVSVIDEDRILVIPIFALDVI